MNQIRRALILGCIGMVGSTAAYAQETVKDSRHKVVFQVSEADPKKWALTLNNAQNVQEDLGKNNVDIEIVAYGPGIEMLKFDSEAGNRIGDAIKSGVVFAACENTMIRQKLTRTDMLSQVVFVKAGVVHLMKRQREGYAYIRP
jgi:uncharacterized protein